MRVTLLLFDHVTALDAIGPYEVLSRVPGWEVEFAAAQAGPQRTDSEVTAISAGRAMEEVEATDVLLVPGGPGARSLTEHRPTLDWVRRMSEGARWTTSVCTGALVLGAAGLLRGRRATTHWMYMDRLRELGAEPTEGRVVEDGGLITAAGVSAGIDMALALVGRAAHPDVARAVQLGIEYDPDPPFDAGSPAKAGEGLVEIVRSISAQRDELLAARRAEGA